MSIRRPTILPLIVTGVLILVGTPQAQFPKVRVPKAPTIPGVNTPGPAPGRPTYGAGITDDMIARYLKALKVQKEVLEKERAEAEAEKARAAGERAKADALTRKRAERMVSTMMQTEECKDAFKEKDPRSKEIARLEDQVAAADTRGDEAKSEELRKRLDPLNTALDVDADRACGGKGSAALMDCLDNKKKALAKDGITEPMLSIQAQGECMQDPSTSGMAGATNPSAEEQAANQAAVEKIHNAKANADKAGADAAGLTADAFLMLDHCIRNRIHGGPGCAEDSNIVIDRHREELKRAVGE
jgi:hypothetical protein